MAAAALWGAGFAWFNQLAWQPGVPPAAREEIFARFHSLRPEGEAFGRHSGLGLAIAKRLCDLHGWQLAVSSPLAAGRGTAFTLSFAGAGAE